MRRTLPWVALLAAVLGAAPCHAKRDRDEPADPTAYITRSYEAEYAFLKALIGYVQDGTWPVNAAHLLDPRAAITKADRDPLDALLRRTQGLLVMVRAMSGARDLEPEAVAVASVATRAEKAAGDTAARKALFMELCRVRRRIALANPALDFERLVYMNAGAPFSGHVSGAGPVAHTRIAWSGFKYRHDEGELPPHLRGGRLGYVMDDWRYAPSGRQGAPWDTPRFRSTQYADFGEKLGKYGERRSRGARGSRGLVTVTGWREGAPRAEALLGEDTRVAEGPNAGVPFAEGVFAHDWDLDFDGERVAFTWLHRRMPNVYTARVDGSAVTQLTDTVWQDFNPVWLPSGRIVFRSSRRFVIDRCQPWDHENYSRRHCATPYSMKADGTDVYPISWHETNEAQPAVDNDGRLVFSRWDYIDRGFNAAQHIWHMYPDGRDPRALHGNYRRPWYPDDEARSGHLRPIGEFGARPVPGETGLYAVLASGHHNVSSGNPVLVDTRVPDDGDGSQVRQIIDGIGLAGDQNGGAGITGVWPLSGDVFLVSCPSRKPGVHGFKGLKLPPLVADDGVYLLDRFGNLEPLITDACFGKHGKPATYWGVRPLAPRPRPRVIPTATWQGERRGTEDHRRATISVMNVYDADFAWPEGRKPTRLRIVRLWGRPWARPGGHYPTLGSCKGSVGRMSVGTAPIEPDGSVYVEAPVECQIYFQVLDQHGMAIQSMRSGAYVHPGEQLTCRGCHEPKRESAPPKAVPISMRRPPSKLRPEVGGPYPQTFARLVEPVFQAGCVGCHTEKKKGPQAMGYWDVQGLAWSYGNGGLGGENPYYRSPSGRVGAAASRLGQTLLTSHRETVTEDQRRRVYLWLDLNSGNLSDYRHEEEQVRGRIVWPWEGDPARPQAIERDRPLPVDAVGAGGVAAALERIASEDWQARHWGYEAVRQLGPKARPATARLEEALETLIADGRLFETEALLRAMREVDADATARGVAKVAALVRGDDPAVGFEACTALKVLGDASAPTLAALAHAVRAKGYDRAQAAAEALVALGKRAAPIGGELVPALESPYPRIAAMVAELLGTLGPETPGAVAGLARVLAERSGDYTWLGRPPEALAKVPAVTERMALLDGTVYRPGRKFGERQPNALIAACNLERGWERQLITRAARALGHFGEAARPCLPVLARAAMLDAGDLPVLVEAAVRIDGAEAVHAAAAVLEANQKNPDRAVRLVTFLGRLGEELSGEPREAAVTALASARPAGRAAQEAARWQGWLTPDPEPAHAGR